MTARALDAGTRGRIVALHGEAGVRWLAALDATLDSLARAWGLVSIGTPFAGARPGLVAPATRTDGSVCVLKVHVEPRWGAHEAAALAHWRGRGAVALLAHDDARGALLLERLAPGDALTAQCAVDDREATAQAASVIAALRTAGDGSGPALPSITTWTDVLRSPATMAGPPRLAGHAARAARLADELLPGSTPVVLHGDLHQANILRATRAPWLAIDPRGMLGPRECESAALLRNPRRFVLAHPAPGRLLADRVAVLAERLGDDPRPMAAWAYVLATVAAAWTLEDGEGDEELARWLACAELLAGAGGLSPGVGNA